MKKYQNKNNTSITILTAILLLLIIGCTTDNTDLETPKNELSASNSKQATPVVGNVYTIKNLGSGRTLDIVGGSNNNGANLQVWGTDVNISSTHRHWEIISVDGNYVRLKGVDSGKSLEVSGGNNSNGVNVQQWAYQGTTHQQWEIIPVEDGYFRIKNRDSGKSLRASGNSNGANVDQWVYRGWDSQKWFFTQVEVLSTPTISVASNVLINTNDGVFTLNDFQIESSSHLSSTTSTTTTSWSYNDTAILGSEWYTLSGGDYYLKSASNDGKRTEWKEHSGIESSLNTNKVLKYEASVANIPENGLTIAQVHNRFNESTDYRSRRPYLRVYIDADRKIKIKETTNDLTLASGTYNTVSGPDYTENQKFKVQLTLGSGIVNVKVEFNSETLDEDFTPNTNGGWSDYQDYFYLKAGVYTEGNDTEPTIRFYCFEKS